MRHRKLTLATAESCTGGLIGDLITDVPGSSDYYVGGVVAYSNEAKIHLLGVTFGTLKRSGAVSAATVRQMAHGARTRFHADVGVAVSGIAGPAGGTARKPVGLVFIGAEIGKCPSFGAGRNQKSDTRNQKSEVRIELHRFTGPRRMIKEKAAMAALDLCRRLLEEKG